MLTPYFTKELLFQLFIFIIVYYIYLKYISDSGIIYLPLFVDTILVGLFLFVQKILVSYFQTKSFYDLNMKNKIPKEIIE
jgi:hypothetical protein